MAVAAAVQHVSDAECSKSATALPAIPLVLNLPSVAVPPVLAVHTVCCGTLLK